MVLEGDNESPRGKAMRESLQEKILAVAVKNARARFFIPSTDNHFCGLEYDYVMIDSGCNSVLKGYVPVREDLIATWNIVKNLEKPEGFDDLMDEDHDGDWFSSFDEEDCNEGFFADS